MRILVSISLCLAFVAHTYAQNTRTVRTDRGEDFSQIFTIPPHKNLDKAKFSVLYRLEVLHDTISKNAVKKDNVMLLQIGETTDRYSDYFKQKGDSIIWNADLSKKKPIEYLDEMFAMARGTLNEELYMNYPTAGKLLVNDYISGGRFQYEEPIPKLKWKLERGSKEIVGYECKKATCRLFGRNYTVWYASQIPVSKGPWKFSGLPGLILQVEDDRDQVSWTCIGLEKVKADQTIYYIDRDPIKVSKKDGLKTFNDYQRRKLNWLKASGNISSNSIPANASKSTPYNPIELSD